MTLPLGIAAALSDAKHAEPMAPSGPAPSWRSTPEGDRVRLGPLVSEASQPLAALLLQRRSERDMSAPRVGQLATMLVRAARVLDVAQAPDGYTMSHRPTPSAGGRHPADIYLLAEAVDGLDAGTWIFDPLTCELVVSPRPATAALRRLGEIVDTGAPPAAMLTVARLERTLSRYPTGLSLVWRDVGALLATLHLCATDLGLASSIVGSCGVFIDDPGEAGIDMGALLVGRRTP